MLHPHIHIIKDVFCKSFQKESLWNPDTPGAGDSKLLCTLDSGGCSVLRHSPDMLTGKRAGVRLARVTLSTRGWLGCFGMCELVCGDISFA